MHTSFTGADWAVLGGYVTLLALAGWLTTRRGMDSDGYFLAGHHAPTWLVAISVLSTVQSAATFLGVPDNSYRGDYTYIGGVFASLIAAWIAGNLLIPRFYALRVTTVYELLEARFDATARRAAGVMYLLGRVLASGARLYLAAIAVSMILFLDIAPQHIVISSALLLAFGLAFTFMGGLHSIIWSDLVQVTLYVGAALVVALTLWASLPMSSAEAIAALANAPAGNKLALVNPSADLSAPFGLFAVLTGVVLLNLASSGLDQDITQRLLACENAAKGRRALYASVIVSLPVILLFLLIGSLLWLHYEGSAQSSFNGEKVTVFMHYILTEIPPGLRGLVTVGVIAAAAINSGLISMANVLVNDLYRPFAGQRSEAHFVRAGRAASVVLGLALFAMSILSYYWQRYSDAALLDFVLGVMSFAYSGLLGVYGVALFTQRGNSASVIAAFLAGFLTVLAFQPYVIDSLSLPAAMKAIAFPWQLCAGTLVAAAVCAMGKAKVAILPEPG
ncbi:sodium:solute symporter [Novosphingobium sp. TH158]|uniref:sodium:solute symporter family transporter n=1 Tax=Novosphingobium sp. TH158 TaxID=2067455 RepID=UPI000C7A3087|nr:sodium:solute symporter [Novosphingobium sp. TH158]PLK26484.1 sodium:solute symporter [Novosphingobium sp. TH158]